MPRYLQQIPLGICCKYRGDRSMMTFIPNQQPILMTNSDRLITVETLNLELTVEHVFSWLKMGG